MHPIIIYMYFAITAIAANL